MTRPLIDGDVLRYEVGAAGEMDDEVKSFDYVAAIMDGKIADICKAVDADQDPIIYLTGKGNFREGVAVTKPYKGNRDGYKPYHYQNLTAYLNAQYNTVTVEGMEADDAMSIEQTIHDDTIICTRDKDLRMVPGWHYGWECGNQREFGPLHVEGIGFLILDRSKKSPKLTGGGEVWFWAQMLTGDPTDNIPGCPGVGAVKAYALLASAEPEDYWPLVREMYYSKGKDDDYILEQGQLLWMVRELDSEGNPVLWQLPR